MSDFILWNGDTTSEPGVKTTSKQRCTTLLQCCINLSPVAVFFRVILETSVYKGNQRHKKNPKFFLFARIVF